MPPNQPVPTSRPMSSAPVAASPIKLGIIGLVFGLVVGGAGGAMLMKASSFEKGRVAGMEEAKEKVVASGRFGSAEADTSPVLNLSGEVISVDGNTIMLKAAQVVRNPLEKQAPISRQVRVTEKTEIFKRNVKDSKVFAAEQAAYEKNVRNQEAGSGVIVEPPVRFTQEKVSLSELTAKTSLVAFAESDITYADSFDAVKIMVQNFGLEAEGDARVPAVE